MPRRIVDERGIEWEVWEVGARRPLADMPAAAGDEPGATLLFESATERRHLPGSPSEWESLTTAQLLRLCGSATREPPFLRVSRVAGADRSR